MINSTKGDYHILESKSLYGSRLIGKPAIKIQQVPLRICRSSALWQYWCLQKITYHQVKSLDCEDATVGIC